MKDRVISLAVGSGGKQMQEFLDKFIIGKLSNDILAKSSDSAILDLKGKTAFTTDSFIVSPEFFNGGDIGKLAVCGTVNDLAVAGATPKYLSLSLIIPEGYCFDKLETILQSISDTAALAEVLIVTGDTKVMPRNSLDSIIINTSGVGEIVKDCTIYANIEEGDKIIVTSDIARHAISIMLARDEFGFIGDIESDCTPLNHMMQKIYEYDIKFARDATRGGIAAVLNEISLKRSIGCNIFEAQIPIREDVEAMCKVLGYDPLVAANEGVIVLFVSSEDAKKVVDILHQECNNKKATIVGDVVAGNKVSLNTIIGGKRYVEMPSGEIFPRIC